MVLLQIFLIFFPGKSFGFSRNKNVFLVKPY
jgi:hypothetical protein